MKIFFIIRVFADDDSGLDNLTLTFCYPDCSLNSSGNSGSISRKRKFFGEPPKPDTPPVS